MTIYTAEEIEALEEVVKNPTYQDCDGYDSPRPETMKALESYLQLITNKHPDYVVVPREPTDEMITAGFEAALTKLPPDETMPSGMMRRNYLYTSMIQAAQEG